MMIQPQAAAATPMIVLSAWLGTFIADAIVPPNTRPDGSSSPTMATGLVAILLGSIPAVIWFAAGAARLGLLLTYTFVLLIGVVQCARRQVLCPVSN